MSIKTIAGAALLTFLAGPAYAACTTETKKADLTQDEVNALYDCIKEELRTGYSSGDNQLAKDYQGWKAAASGPASTGTHGKRFLMTYTNDVAFAEYTKYADERGAMPVGSLLAKESFNVSKKGEVRKGPLFFMEKVAAGTADEFGNWVYSAVQPKGKPMKIKQAFCHGCHGAFETQDAMGYPGEDVRLASQ